MSLIRTSSLSLYLFFAVAFFAFWFAPLLFPSIRLFAFVPFLCIALQKKPLLHCLFLASVCGLIIDIFTTETRFGLFSLCSVLGVTFAYRFRFHFFEDNLFALPLYSIWLSGILSLLQLLFILPACSLSLPFLFSTFFVMPLIDGLYALICFTMPLMLKRVVLNR